MFSSFQARWKVTSKEALAQISEYSEAGITVRGQYFAPGKGDHMYFLTCWKNLNCSIYFKLLISLMKCKDS